MSGDVGVHRGLRRGELGVHPGGVRRGEVGVQRGLMAVAPPNQLV